MKKLYKNILAFVLSLSIVLSGFFSMPCRAFAVTGAEEVLVGFATDLLKAQASKLLNDTWEVASTAYGWYSQTQYLSWIKDNIMSMNTYQLRLFVESLQYNYPEYVIYSSAPQGGSDLELINDWWINSPQGTVSIHGTFANIDKIADMVCRWIVFIINEKGYSFPTESNPMTGTIEGSSGSGSGGVTESYNQTPLLSADNGWSITQTKKNDSTIVFPLQMRWLNGDYGIPNTVNSNSVTTTDYSYNSGSGVNAVFTHSQYSWNDVLAQYEYIAFFYNQNVSKSTSVPWHPGGMGIAVIGSHDPMTITMTKLAEYDDFTNYSVSLTSVSGVYSLANTNSAYADVVTNSTSISLDFQRALSTNPTVQSSITLVTNTTNGARIGFWAWWPGIDSPVSSDGSIPSVSNPTTGTYTGSADLSTVEDLLATINDNLVSFFEYVQRGFVAFYQYLDNFGDFFESALKLVNQAQNNILLEIQSFEDDVHADFQSIFNLLSAGDGGSSVIADSSVTSAENEDFENRIADMSGQLKSKFPFSIPWDIAVVLHMFDAPAQAPQFSITIPFSTISSNFDDLVLSVDMGAEHFAWVRTLTRMTTRVLWTAELIVLTRKFGQHSSFGLNTTS